MTARNPQISAELLFLPAVVLHELSHIVVARAFGLEYELYLRPFDAEVTRSYVQFDRFPSTFGAICVSLAPYSLLPVAVLVTLLLDITLSFGSLFWLFISALLFLQGFGIVFAAAPSEYDLMLAFGQAGRFNGRVWLHAAALSTGLSVGFTFLWVVLTIFFVTGYGVTSFSFPWLLPWAGVVGVGTLLSLEDYRRPAAHASADLRSQYAAALAERGADESARYQFERTIATLEADGTEYAPAYMNYAGFLFDRWYTARALSYAWRALEIDPDCPAGQLIAGGALFRMERYGEAFLHCERALELVPEDSFGQDALLVDAHIACSACLLGQDCIEEAEEHCERALELDPTAAGAYANDAWTYAERGAFVEAEHRYERAVELADDPLTVVSYATFHDTYGDDGEAERWFRQALLYDSNCLYTHEKYLDFLTDRGRIDDADRERILTRVRPEDEPVLICLWPPEAPVPVEIMASAEAGTETGIGIGTGSETETPTQFPS